MSSRVESNPQESSPGKESPREPPRLSQIAVGVDGHPGGEDAAVLGAALARGTGAGLMLVSVHAAPMIPLPMDLSWTELREQAMGILRDVRDSRAPGARIDAEIDSSVARALDRLVRRHHQDLLVVGSSKTAEDGHVGIGKRTRQLLCHFERALAVAPRGLHERPFCLGKIGVGYDAGPEADSALALAQTIAVAAGAELSIRGVVDDRVPLLLRSALGGLIATEWRDAMSDEEGRLRDKALAAAAEAEVPTTVDMGRGRPADALLALSEDVDLLVIGSRHWGPTARVLLGSTGEKLLHDASCPVLAVPRPSA